MRGSAFFSTGQQPTNRQPRQGLSADEVWATQVLIDIYTGSYKEKNNPRSRFFAEQAHPIGGTYQNYLTMRSILAKQHNVKSLANLVRQEHEDWKYQIAVDELRDKRAMAHARQRGYQLPISCNKHPNDLCVPCPQTR